MKQKKFSCYEEFRSELSSWIEQNPDMLYLDGSNGDKPNGIPYSSFEIDFIGQSLEVALRSDTKKETLIKVVSSDLKDFIIVPPSPGNKHWRFDFLEEFKKEDYGNRAGLYAYVMKLASSK